MKLSKRIEKIEDRTEEMLASMNVKRKLIAEKIKTFNSKHGKKVVISAALIGILAAGKGCSMNKTDNPIKTTDNDNINKIMQSYEKEIGEHLAFDPNSEKEMINRIAKVYVDASAKGLGDLTVEQWMDWYTVTNINDISPAEYYKLLDDTKTPSTIMENYDYVNNALLEDAITVTPNTIIDLEPLVADKKSAKELSSFQSALAALNTANDSSKKKLAADVNEYLYNEFVTSKHKTVSASSNLTRMKLLLGTWEITNNHSWVIPSADISKIIYPSGDAKCDLASKAVGTSVWNDQKVVVRNTVEEKINMMFKLMANEDKSKQDVRTILRSLEIEMAIEEMAKEMGLVKVENPDSEKAIMDAKPQPPKVNTITEQEKKNVVTNPKTGKKEIHLPAKEESKKPVLEQIEKENKNEEIRAKGVQEGAQAGNQNGYADGAAKKTYNENPKIDLSKSDKIYADAYTTYYKQYYAEGYAEGLKLAQGPITQKEETIVTKQNKENIEDLKKIMIENGERDGYAAGDAEGYTDGYSGKKYNDRVKINHENADYVKAYIDEYKDAYRKGYRNGERDREKLEQQFKQNETHRDNKHSTIIEDKHTVHPDGSTTTEEFEFLPGFYEKDGKIYDEHGNEVEIIGSNSKTNQNIAALKTLRNVLASAVNTNDYSKTKTI